MGSLNVNTYTELADLDQAYSAANPPIETNASLNLIDEYARRERGDHRVIAALLTIERENAQPDLESIAAPPIQPPAIAADYAYDGQSPYFDASPLVHPSHMVCNALAAARIGKAIIRSQRKLVRAGGISRKIAPVTPLKRRSVVGKPRPRAAHSHTAHGTARRKTGDSGDSDPTTKPRPRIRREPPFTVGWHKNYNFPSAMGKLVNPGSKAFSTHTGLSVVVIGPNHAGREGQKVVVKTVAGKATAVILGKLRETLPRLPVSFYHWHFDREARS
jgi:hypothetical protein